MAFKEVTQLATEKEYETICQQYDELKQHISDCIEFEDFETLSSYDLAKIKELHYQKSELFWKLKVDAIQEKIDKIKQSNPRYYESDIEFCELAIKKLTYYAEQKKAELKAKGDVIGYEKYHKPTINNQIMHFKMQIELNEKLRKKLDTGRKRTVEVIP